jgi:hypothetical protein
MPNAIYTDEGTSQLFTASGGNVTHTLTSLASGAGRISAQKDWGVAPRPYIYHLSAYTQFLTGGTAGQVVNIYIAEAPAGDSSQISGDLGASDVAIAAADVPARWNMQWVGAISNEKGDTSKCTYSGIFESRARYFSLVWVNDTDVALSATASQSGTDIQPMYDEAQ